MFKELKNTAKQTSIYSLGNLLPKLVGFILLPLYTDHLSVSEYGILAILQATSQVLIGVFGFNLQTAMLRWLAQEKEEVKQKSIVFTALLSTAIIVIILSAILLPFSSQSSIWFFEHTGFTNYFVLLFISSGFGILNNIPLNLIRFKEKSVYYIILTTIKFTIILLLNIYFVAFRQTGVEGIILSELIGNVVLILLSSKFVVANINLRFNFSVFKQMFGYGFPLIFSTTFSLALTLGDRYILKFLLNDSSVGIYSLGQKIASFINVFLIQSFQLGYLPIAFKKYNEENAELFYSKVQTYFVYILSFTALVVSLFGREIIVLFTSNKSYWDAASVIPVISLGFVLKGIQYVDSLSFHLKKKTSFNALVVIITSVVNVGLNFVLIPIFNYNGAAYSFLASMFVMIVLTYFISKKVYPVPYEMKKILGTLLMAVTIYFISVYTTEMQMLLAAVLKTALLLIFAGLLFALSDIKKEHLANFKTTIKKLIK